MLILPAIDLRNGCCVRLTQGRKDSAKVYDGNPVDIAQAFEAAGAKMIHIVDLDGAFSESNSRNRQTLQEIVRAIQIPVQFGGGLRQLDAASKAIDLGVARIVIGTLAVESSEILETLLLLFGSERVAVGIDSRSGQVVTRGWENDTALSAVNFARHLASLGVERIIHTDVSRDGMLNGIDLDATCEIARACGLRVTASGGVSSLEDIRRVIHSSCGIDSMIIGKALYEGYFTIEEALALAEQ